MSTFPRRVGAALVAPVLVRNRTVLATYPGLRLGNFLYFLLRARVKQSHGSDYRVVGTETMDEWWDRFPQLHDALVIARQDVRWWHGREHLDPLFFQQFDVDFSRADLVGFISRFLLASPLFTQGDAEEPPVDPHAVTVNVRRGDYYADSTFRGLYGFDVQGYLRVALSEVTAGRDITTIRVVSDGVDWCRENLGWLAEHADAVTYAGSQDGPHRNLLDIARSRRLVLTNSTFSYWGAYISNVIHGTNHDQVWAPRFHSRGVDGGRAWQLDPHWHVVETIPGGWDAPF